MGHLRPDRENSPDTTVSDGDFGQFCEPAELAEVVVELLAPIWPIATARDLSHLGFIHAGIAIGDAADGRDGAQSSTNCSWQPALSLAAGGTKKWRMIMVRDLPFE